MFTCSNCGHKINAPEAQLPPFCPRCGTATGVDSNPFAGSMIDDDDELDSLPPPPPMDSMPDSPSQGRGGPSKTLFGMPGLSSDELELEDEGETNFSAPVVKPAPPPAAKPAPPPVKPPPVGGKPPPAPPGKPPVPAPPLGAKPPIAPPKPPLPGAVPLPPKPGAGVKPPPLPPPLGAKPGVPPLPGAKPVAPPPTPRAADAPTRPAVRAPSAPTGPGRPAPTTLPEESGSFVREEESGTFEKEDPFFTGNPDELPELGSITDGDLGKIGKVDRFDSGPADMAPRPTGPGSGPVGMGPVGMGPVGMKEFEFDDDDDGGGKLELGELLGGSSEVVDLPTATVQERTLPEFDGIEMPLALGEVELPNPVAEATDGLDLPTPSGSPHRPDELEFDGFGPGGELDLPMPLDSGSLDLDLPDQSASRPVSKPAASKPSASKPTQPSPASAPAKPSPASTPAKSSPASTPAKPSPASKPAPSLPPLPELSDDFDLDLPAPSSELPTLGSELPTPVDDFGGFSVPESGLELDDLPLPADELPASATKSKSSGNLPVSASELPTPADILPTPVESLGLDLGDEPPRRKPEPVDKPIAKIPEPPAKPILKSPAPKPERRSPTRAILYGALGVVVLVLALGVYGMGEGWFDGEEQPPPQRAQQGGNDEGGDNPEPTPSSEVAERSEAILAKFDEDSPAGYVQALDGLAQDGVAQAEAALLLHLRYGPDPVRLAQASKLLESFADNPAPHVRRVLGLALLTQPLRSAEALTWFGDDARSQLYRAWALQASDPAKAREAAEAAVKLRPGDKAAALTLAELQLTSDPEAALTRLRTIVGQQPQQISAQLALLRATRDQGLLAEAAQIGNGLSAVSVSNGYKAELLRTRASIARAQGNVAEAMRLIEQAIASDEQGVGPRLDKIDLALGLRDAAGARTEAELLLRERPQDRAVMMAITRVAIEAGRDDDALTQLQALGGVESTDPAVHELYGDLKALLLDLDGARQAWAKARELDPLRSSTIVNEVALLTKLEQPALALALLDEQKAKLAALPDQSMNVKAARAVVERTRARVLRSRAEPGPALTAVEEAVALDPRDNASRLLRAELLGAVGNVEASEEALDELHRRTGGFPGLTEPLGRTFLRKGKLDELDALIGSQLEASEASVETLMTGAALRLAQNKPDQAKVLAERVLDRDGTQLRAHLMLGRALLAQGEYAAALDEIEAAQTREGDSEVELWLGQALEYNGRAVDARAHYKKALELEPGNLEAAALLGRLYAYEGAAKQALAMLEPVVQKTDAYPYAYLAIGIAHRDLSKRDQAVGEFQRARELDPTLFEAYYEEGRILNDRNKHSAAAAALQAGIDKAKDNAQPRQLEDAWRRLGESYYELGKRADAKKAFEEYLKVASPSAPGRAEVQRLMRDL
ncbi:tetratricopeptide repeat protein [Nannocystaceae bacterium ST9]